jgi:primosomal protein N' (replication factor Y)
LIEKTIQEGKQVLYLLPEIALTVQIVSRLQQHFGNKIVVYHSKFNQNERVEIWNDVMDGRPIVLGARSALFLPFNNLGLVIVDEEHDPSFKQTDPAPRYNARDTAVYFSMLYGAKVLLGTATPSIETFRNVQTAKYGYVLMNQRFGNLEMPKLMIVDIAEESRRKRMKSNFSEQLLEQIKATTEAGEQVILFQNRRGYAPVYQCVLCGWIAQCEHCDVSLTYHKHTNDLHCHYCSYQQPLPKVCKACSSHKLSIRGFGTEKIEDDLKIYLPELKIARMDLDTVKGKDGHEKIIQLFENKEVEVLVGTQMVSKGLDFDNVGLVAVMSADQMINYPDFRATERTFQLITQVAGRAGRKNKQGKVIIQAFNVSHPVLQELIKYNFDGFYKREIGERSDFFYPPFCRLIQIQLKHKNEEPLQDAVNLFAEELKNKLGDKVLGPVSPAISKIRNYFIREILIKCHLNIQEINETKHLITHISNHIKEQKSMSNLRIAINVDPY